MASSWCDVTYIGVAHVTIVASMVPSCAGKGALSAVSEAKGAVRVDPNGRCSSTSRGKAESCRLKDDRMRNL